jgi:excisionase family DNA binding protein
MSQSLLVADPQLADTEAALAEWRKTLHCLSHIPEDLWSRATELAERHGLAKVTVALKLDTTRLKRWLRGTDKTSTEGGRASPPSPALVEFNFVLPLAQSPCVLVMDDRWLSVDEIADYLGVAKDTIYTWVTSKGMPGHKVGRFWKFKKEDVDAWVREGGAAASSDDFDDKEPRNA